MPDGPRYAFHPLERRGLLLGLDAGQLVTLAGAAVAALVVHSAVGGSAGVLFGLVIGTGGVLGAVWTRDGRPVAARAVVALAWLARRASGRMIDEAPTRGRDLSTDAPARTALLPPGRTQPAGLQLVQDPGMPGEAPMGVVRDRRAGTWVAVMAVSGCSFSLLDPSEQAQRLEGWRAVLGSAARPGSPVVRLQWLRRSWSGPAAPLGAPPVPPPATTSPPDASAGAVGGAEAARRSYQALLDGSLPQMARHQAWVVLAVRPGRQTAGRSSAARAVNDLRREMRLLDGQLRSAGLTPGEPLDLGGLAELIAGAGRQGPVGAASAWPIAAEETWSAYRADGELHATYWVAEWPRLDVGPNFLTPLLVVPARTAVSVVMAPVAPDRAMREVRSARTADLADAQMRARAGFLPSARRERESEGATRREAELADGHQDFRFSGYVTVSAAGRPELDCACAAVEHAAQSARVEIRRLFGRQAEAYTWTLPLARGLR